MTAVRNEAKQLSEAGKRKERHRESSGGLRYDTVASLATSKQWQNYTFQTKNGLKQAYYSMTTKCEEAKEDILDKVRPNPLVIPLNAGGRRTTSACRLKKRTSMRITKCKASRVTSRLPDLHYSFSTGFVRILHNTEVLMTFNLFFSHFSCFSVVNSFLNFHNNSFDDYALLINLSLIIYN